MEELSLKINHPDDGKFLQQIGWNKEQIRNMSLRSPISTKGLHTLTSRFQMQRKIGLPSMPLKRTFQTEESRLKMH